MDFEKQEKTCGPSVHPLNARPSLWAQFSFSWMTPLLALGVMRPLQESDCPPLPEEMHSEASLAMLVLHMRQRPDAPLWHAFSATFRGQFVIAGVLRLLSECGSVLAPLLLQQTIIFCQGGQSCLARFQHLEGPLLCLMLFLAITLQLTALQHFVDRVFNLGMQVVESHLSYVVDVLMLFWASPTSHTIHITRPDYFAAI